MKTTSLSTKMPRLLRHLFAISSLLAISCTLSSGQNLINYGGFESWNPTTGTPPVGNPFGWGNNAIQTAGLDGSTYAPTITSDFTSGLIQTWAEAKTDGNFSFSFQFISTAPAIGATNRSLQLILRQPGNSTPINMIVSRGSSAELLSLKFFDGSTFQTVAEDAFATSTFDSINGVWSNISEYQLTIDVHLGAGKEASSYSITYGLIGGSMTTISDLSYFQSAPIAQGLDQVRFATNANGTPFSFDNVSLTQTIPEPSSFVLLAAVSVLCILRKRCQRA